MSGSLGLFGGRDRPDVASAWKLYEESERFNSAIDLYDTSLDYLLERTDEKMPYPRKKSPQGETLR